MAIENDDLLVLQKNGDSSIRKATVGALLAGVVVPTVNDATEDAKGILELATQDEVDAGTDDERAVTPLKLKTFADANQTASVWQRNGTVLSPVTANDSVDIDSKIIVGADFRNGLTSEHGVEIDGVKGIVHVKGRDVGVTPFEVFGSGTDVNSAMASVFRVKNDGSVHLSHDKVEIDPDGTARFEGTVTAESLAGISVTANVITATVYDIESLPELP